MNIPENYTEEQKIAYKKGFFDARSEAGKKGGENKWKGVSLEDRVAHSKMMLACRKIKVLTKEDL